MMTPVRLSVLLPFLCLALAPDARAWPPTYGSEYNFGNAEIRQAWEKRGYDAKFQGRWQDPGPTEQEAATRFADKVRERCKEDCDVTSHVGKFGSTEYRVKFKDGYGFNISIDPDTVEIQTNPETLAQMKTFEAREQQFIFDVARDMGLNGADMTAHFNIGILSAFEGDPKSFLRFFINYHNLPELASGALGRDYANAPPISHLKPGQREALAKIVREVNEGAYKGTVQELAARIQNEVYTSTPTFDVGYHYQGISVKYVKPSITLATDKPMELRMPRQPETAHERTLLAELFQKRFEYEKSTAGAVAFLDVPKVEEPASGELANRYRLYVTEMGGDWDHFKELLPASLRDLRPDAFLAGKIDWSSAYDVETVKSYTRYLPSSPWVRKRMTELLTAPEALASGKANEIRAAARKALGSAANPEARAAMKEFLETPGLPFKKVSCFDTIRGLLHGLWARLRPAGAAAHF